MSPISPVPIAGAQYNVTLRSQRCLIESGKCYRVFVSGTDPTAVIKKLKIEFDDVKGYRLKANVPTALEGGQSDSAVFRSRIVDEHVQSKGRAVRVPLGDPPGGYRGLVYPDGEKVWDVKVDFQLFAPRDMGLAQPSVRVEMAAVTTESDGGHSLALAERSSDSNESVTGLYAGLDGRLRSSRTWDREEIVLQSLGYKNYRPNIGDTGILWKLVYLEGVTDDGVITPVRLPADHEANATVRVVAPAIAHSQLIISHSRAKMSVDKEVGTPSTSTYRFDLARDAWVLFDEVTSAPVEVQQENGIYSIGPWIPADMPVTAYYDPTGARIRDGVDEGAPNTFVKLEIELTNVTKETKNTK